MRFRKPSVRLHAARSRASRSPLPAAHAQAPAKKPHILVIFGDDVGQTNISAYSFGVVGYTRRTSTGSPRKA
jgi:arylsulfatase